MLPSGTPTITAGVIGTQTVAKGWHFPHPTRVGVVDADHAREEGEGDLSLEHWRESHERFFTEHAEGGFRPDMPVVLERFRVLYPST